jgi:hypothetical protein
VTDCFAFLLEDTMRRGADVASDGPGQVRAVDRGMIAMGPSGSLIGPEANNLSQSHGASKNVVGGRRSKKGRAEVRSVPERVVAVALFWSTNTVWYRGETFASCARIPARRRLA